VEEEDSAACLCNSSLMPYALYTGAVHVCSVCMGKKKEKGGGRRRKERKVGRRGDIRMKSCFTGLGEKARRNFAHGHFGMKLRRLKEKCASVTMYCLSFCHCTDLLTLS